MAVCEIDEGVSFGFEVQKDETQPQGYTQSFGYKENVESRKVKTEIGREQDRMSTAKNLSIECWKDDLESEHWEKFMDFVWII